MKATLMLIYIALAVVCSWMIVVGLAYVVLSISGVIAAQREAHSYHDEPIGDGAWLERNRP